MMNNRLYDVLKWIALVLLPALGTLYFALAGIWDFPYRGGDRGHAHRAGRVFGRATGHQLRAIRARAKRDEGLGGGRKPQTGWKAGRGRALRPALCIWLSAARRFSGASAGRGVLIEYAAAIAEEGRAVLAVVAEIGQQRQRAAERLAMLDVDVGALVHRERVGKFHLRKPQVGAGEQEVLAEQGAQLAGAGVVFCKSHAE